MAKISRLSPGQTVWSVIRQQQGNTAIRETAVFPVEIVEVGEGWVIAKWNNNRPRRYYPNQVKNWRVNKP